MQAPEIITVIFTLIAFSLLGYVAFTVHLLLGLVFVAFMLLGLARAILDTHKDYRGDR